MNFAYVVQNSPGEQKIKIKPAVVCAHLKYEMCHTQCMLEESPQIDMV